MAHVISHPVTPSGITAPVSRFFSRIGEFLMSMAETNSRVRQVEALSALSDDELAQRGLKRSEIARYVFSDSYWL